MKTKRQDYFFKHRTRSKCILNPRMVDIMTVHYIEQPYNSCKQIFVPHTKAAVHHYRRLDIEYKGNFVIDQTTFKYSRKLIGRVSHMKEKILRYLSGI